MKNDFILHICVAILSVSIVLGVLANRGHWLLPNQSICFSRVLFHQDCPGCGLTHSFVSLGGGHLMRSWELNPLGPVLFALIIAMLFSRLSAPRMKRTRTPPFEIFLGGAAVVAIATRAIWYYTS